MQDESNLPEDFTIAVKNWWEHLNMQIERIKKQGKKPILVALSRKMPRFFDWFCKHYSEGNTIVKNDVCLITELAIPFLFAQSDVSDKEFIILDDMIILGGTLSVVAKDIHALTNKLSHVSCIFVHERAIFPDTIELSDVSYIKRSSQEEINRYVNIIANIVERHQLPIDLEFPILALNDVSYWECIKQDFEQKNKDFRVLMHKNNNSRFSVLLSRKFTDEYFSDFSKMRFYKNDKKINVEIFSPTIFSEYSLISSEKPLFDNELYQKIWEDTTKYVKERLNELIRSKKELFPLKKSYLRSLCVWANYLLSLSCYITCKNSVQSLKNFTICEKNLSFLIGPDLSKIIMPKLSLLLDNSANTHIYQNIEPDDIPDCFAPEPFDSALEVEKGRILIESNTGIQILKNIFSFQHYTNDLFDIPQYRIERLFFGETYSSLERSNFPFYQQDDDIDNIHIWLDEMIDKGCIVPKYEFVQSGGTSYIRRFFHSGLRKISDVK